MTDAGAAGSTTLGAADFPNRGAECTGSVRHPLPVGDRFSLHWGSGVIEEEVRVGSSYHQPAIELLNFTEGVAAGTRELRFCYYDHHGRFQRSPLIIGEKIS
jgi:hypothetical protein